jgi:hypothetical protein
VPTLKTPFLKAFIELGSCKDIFAAWLPTSRLIDFEVINKNYSCRGSD